MADPPQPQWPIREYTSTTTQFPYSTQDLQPMDTSPDSYFYDSPRFVTHIDDHAISVLRTYYGSVLEPLRSSSSNPPRILDLCSSWISHYPPAVEAAAARNELRVAGLGMNAEELAANPLFGSAGGKRYLVRDLNVSPLIPAFDAIRQEKADADGETVSGTVTEPTADGDDTVLISATTLTVSIDYMTGPVELLASLLARTAEGGTVHIAVSSRCFPTKAVRRWLRMSVEERLEMVAEMLVWSGWADVEILVLCDGRAAGGSGERVDPLWIVRGRKGKSSMDSVGGA